MKAAGRYEVVWHGNNSRGAGVAIGVYLYRIVSGSRFNQLYYLTKWSQDVSQPTR
jgi:hypothetical protein